MAVDGSDEQQTQTIRDIHVHGNVFTPTPAILHCIPFHPGELFEKYKVRSAIVKLYNDLKRFKNVAIQEEVVDDQEVILHVVVQEKYQLKNVLFKGNKQLTEAVIKEKIDFGIPAIDESDLKIFQLKLESLYIEKGFGQTTINSSLELDELQQAVMRFDIKEGPKSLIKQIKFTGNKSFSDKVLRGILYSQEDWLLSFLDQSAAYIPEKIDADKHMLEQHYKNNGYLQAHILNTIIDPVPNSPHVIITFEIEEGDLYTIDKVTVTGNDLITQEGLLASIPIKPGMPYSEKKIRDSINNLEKVWGNFGFIFAHIDPSVSPNDETKTVDIGFNSEVGEKVILNKITIKGNKKTRDKVVRRRITLQEGDEISKLGMEQSKRFVESLGYFDQRKGVNWKIRRLASNRADLDLILEEGKTGQANIQIGYGGVGQDINANAAGVTVKGGIADRNVLGTGVNMVLDASWAREQSVFNFHIDEPYLLDKPISAGFDLYHKRPTYDSLRNVNGAINEKLTGAAVTLGFISRYNTTLLFGTQILTSLGFDSVHYEQRPQASINGAPLLVVAGLQYILDKEFAQGEYFWIAQNFEQDTRNHPIHTSRGHSWKIATKVGLPGLSSPIGYYKASLDAHWYTPLINEYSLVFHLHGYFGIAAPFTDRRSIPFDDLYHIGGPRSVRGFNFGDIGPKYAGDTIGATKAFFWNAELIFPITPDMSIKGVIFYDGGGSFDAPYLNYVDRAAVTNNNFDYRHAIGFGIRLLQPMPISIDWGFKIDPRKDRRNPDRSETSNEVHFGMNYGW